MTTLHLRALVHGADEVGMLREAGHRQQRFGDLSLGIVARRQFWPPGCNHTHDTLLLLVDTPDTSIGWRVSINGRAEWRPSSIPKRSCSLVIHLGAHQFHSPMTCMNAGSRTIRTKVASTRIASVRPRPNSRMNETCAAISAANEMDMTTAAAVTTRPVRAMPNATLSSLSTRVRTDRSQNSRIRETRNTS